MIFVGYTAVTCAFCGSFRVEKNNNSANATDLLDFAHNEGMKVLSAL
jgi:hypothetical protein